MIIEKWATIHDSDSWPIFLYKVENMKKIKRKIISFIISLIMFINVPLCGFCVSYADGITDYNPALIPIFTLVSTIMIGSGIVARNASDSLNQLASNVINNIKNTEVARSEADPTYNSPYVVINGGKKEKPSNDNKNNGKWFGLGVASALGASVAFEKGATEDIMRTVDELNGYKTMAGSQGIISADNFKTKGTASYCAMDLANISTSALKQFNEFLASDFWENNDIDKNDCLFFVNTYIPDILKANPTYPITYITVIEKSDDLKYVDVRGNAIGYYTFTNNYGSLSYYYPTSGGNCITFLNEDHIALKLRTAKISISNRDANTNFRYGIISRLSLNSSIGIYGYTSSPTDINRWALSGYKWQSENPWTFTNNVYNNTQNFTTNFPDWMQETFNLLGQNVEGIRLGIDSLNEYWQNTQPNVQIGETPENVIAQLLNNYLNPETAPDPEPEPDPDPGTDPNPDPKPYAPEVFLPFSETALEDGAQQLWEWTLGKITLPDGFWDKIPFSIPYDIYLLTSSMFPVSSGNRRMLKATVNSPIDPNGITISSNFEASGINTRVYNMGANKWVQTAPVINLDLHFKYHDTSGNERTLDYVKTVDLAPYAYFAMIIYIAIYITWFGVILGFIVNMFK